MNQKPSPHDSADGILIGINEAKRLLQQGEFAESKNLLETLLQKSPNNIEGLYLLSVCYRYLKEFSSAKTNLEKLLSLNPKHASAHQEAAHLNRMANDTESATQYYQKAVSLNPALLASWKQLAGLHHNRGDKELAAKARAQYERLEKLPSQLLAVSSLIHESNYYKAEQLCRHFLQENKHHVEAMRLLALIGSKLNVLDDAEFLLESCVEFSPNFHQARYDYIDVLHRRQKYAKALEQAQILHQYDPNNTAFETAFARENLAVGKFDIALTKYNELAHKNPHNPHVFLVRGHALKTIGEQDDAIDSYRRVVHIKPDFGDAFWSLANLKTYRFNDDEIEHMKHYESRNNTALYDRFHLCFALGKAFEDRKKFSESFSYYARGNALKKSESHYTIERNERETKEQIEHCNGELFAKYNNVGCQAPDPIFIVGLPRAGSTLLEQILASHSQVDGTLELPNILALAYKLGGRRRWSETSKYPAVLHEFTAEQFKQYGEDYIRDTRIYRHGAPFFTDKMPNNFRHIGLIHLMLPNAKIIDARRHPLACCFSGFKQLFAEGQEFTYGLEEIGKYYKDYVELMDHWDRVLPGKILRIQYEEVISDFETQVKRLLDFCNLPFEQNCIEFHKTERAVRTASSEQVRQPLYQSGLEQWVNYAPYLDPLKQALGAEVMSRYPID